MRLSTTVAVNQDFVTRTAGLPLEAVAGLTSPTVREWASAVLRSEAVLEAARLRAWEALGAAVGDDDDPVRRRALVQLRREAHNGRAPRLDAGARSAVETLSEDRRSVVEEWFRAVDEHGSLLGRGDRAVAADAESVSAHLAGLAEDPQLRRGLMLASPALDLAWERAAAKGRLGAVTARDRRRERSFAQYVYRTACKTSPFSTLTSVAVGQVGSTPEGRSSVSAGEQRPLRSRTRLNVAVLPRIVEAIRADPARRDDLPVELVSGWRVQASRIRYVRRMRSVGDPTAAVTMDSVEDQLFFLSSGSLMATVLEVLTLTPALRVGELCDEVERRLGGSATPDQVRRFVDTLLRLELLVVRPLKVDLHADDPVLAFEEGLTSLGCGWAAPVVEVLRDVRSAVARFATASVVVRRQLLADVRASLGALVGGLTGEEVVLPRTLVYEDTSAPTSTTVSAETFASHAEDLARVASILPCFDPLLPQRLTLRGFFVLRFGRGGTCSDLVRFVHDFHLDLFDEFLKASMSAGPGADGMPAETPNWLGLDDIAALDAARREVVHVMREASARVPGPGGEVVLTAEDLERVARRLPPAQDRVDPRSVFVQVAETGDQPLLVLNRSYTGLTLLFSRFAHCLDDGEPGGLVDRLREHLRSEQPEGVVFAEMTGGVDTSNLNLHPAVTPFELVSPGDTSTRPAHEQIHVDDLQVRHDEATDGLVLYDTRLGVRVVPVYLGYLMPFALSDVQRTLLLFSWQRMAQLDLWSGTDAPLGDRPISSHPRVRHGDVVLVRETWKTAPDRLPDPEEHPDTASWYLAWQRWRAGTDVPRVVFATVSGDSAADDDRPADMGRGKPQYVDLESHTSLELLRDMLRGAPSRLVLTEMLPGPEHLWVRDRAGTYVSEQMIELTFEEDA